MNDWSKEEVLILSENYEGHGSGWSGWSELLPNRTKNAIQTKALKIGLTKSTTHGKSRSSDTYQPPRRTADPYAKVILRMLEQGMTTSEIDSHMRWYPGRAKYILTQHWDWLGEKS